jgi:hypothetical protein
MIQNNNKKKTLKFHKQAKPKRDRRKDEQTLSFSSLFWIPFQSGIRKKRNLVFLKRCYNCCFWWVEGERRASEENSIKIFCVILFNNT